MRTRACDTFGIEFPIFAFSHCRDVVAAVSRAGGLGVAGGLDKATLEQMIPERHRRFIEDVLDHFQVPKLPEGESAYESLLAWSHAGGRSQVDVALGHPIRLLVNAL